MKEEIFEYKLDEYIIKIGKNKEENNQLIDESEETDIWFHVENEPSCHVILKNSDKVREIPKQVIKRCAYLCKINSKAKTESSTVIMYTEVKNIEKTRRMGEVKVLIYKRVIV